MLDKSILAIDTSNLGQALEIGKEALGKVFTIKLGLEFFNSHGKNGIRAFNSLGFKNIMLDLKLHDIPKTVYKAIKALDDIEFGFVTIHGQGGDEMVEMAKLAASEIKSKPQILMVTILTSIKHDNVESQVRELAMMARDKKVNIVCSGKEASLVRKIIGTELLIFTPGIRLENQDHDCQQRVCTPEESLNNGSDKIIIGKNLFLNNLSKKIKYF